MSGLVHSAVRGECPRCGAPTLFATWVRFASRCRQCDLDFSQYNVGDGPASFLILIIGALICAAAITVQLVWAPPFWVHILLWVPLSLASVIGLLRICKAAMLIHEHRAEVREARLDDQEPPTSSS